MAPQSPSRRPEDELIDTIVDHVRKGDAKREEALEHYRQAGEGLIELKKLVGHGKFEPIKAQMSSTLDISRGRIGHLMKLAKEWPVSWDRWQEIQGHKKPVKPEPVKTPAPDPADLDHALKLATMRDRGGTENERAVAADKLSRFASNFGLTADVLETKAKEATAHAAAEDTNQAEWREENYRGETPFDQEYRYWLAIIRREAADADRDTLFQLLAQFRATIAIERGHRRKGP